MSKKLMNTLKTIFLHVVIWFFILLFPFILSEGNELNKLLLRQWVPLIMGSFLIFYVNYFWLLPKVYFNRNSFQFYIFNVVLFGLVLAGLRYGNDFANFIDSDSLFATSRNRKRRPSFGPWFVARNAPLLFMSVGIAFGIRYSQKLNEEERLKKARENEHLKSELKMLKYQLQPHFFFNTLNNIYSLVDTNAEFAKDGILKLAKLMRYLLYKTEDGSTKLKDEIQFIESYIDLMQMRYGDQLTVTANFPKQDVLNIEIPPLLFIPLVENAFKHGVAASDESFIDVDLKLINEELIFSIKNSYFPKSDTDRSGSGIGIQNMQKRLKLLYREEEYSFYQQRVENTFFTELKMKTHHANT
ncbi:sensor histidine kinase [Galbibacter mesophilus]|uniref:sensor histidine kinase n=1 Tax=Galbibacter mesophilus TaxID=379069 RepID=UPI00191FEE73|nr:histidine kinase [Galbibacter mesophilus]MCM5663008.1 histidine kinase [Galbibacter mesophilus]